MYALYNRTHSEGKTRFQFAKSVCLFGCNQGVIPRLLRTVLTPSHSEPCQWHIDVVKRLESETGKQQSLVINLKPKDKQNLALYEVMNVWGDSSSDWTPVMLHLRGLLVDEDLHAFDEKDFTRGEHDFWDPIVTFLYLGRSTIHSGQLVGKWCTAPPSSTNSVLLWPKTLSYFWNQASKLMLNSEGGI